jgi:hypothetical protein
MNDLDKLREIFEILKISYTVELASETGKYNSAFKYGSVNLTWDTLIIIDEGIGYLNFHCIFYFLDGKCQGHGVWD